MVYIAEEINPTGDFDGGTVVVVGGRMRKRVCGGCRGEGEGGAKEEEETLMIVHVIVLVTGDVVSLI